MTPLAIDLFCGLGGWTEGLLAEGYRVVGFDLEQHVYGEHRYPAQLVLQDVLTLHGRQFKDAALIVASPPCQEFSYMAMPWSIAKQKAREYRDGTRDVQQLTALFDACFRIQREASEAAGHHIPLVVENVRGAQKWVGPAKANFGSFFLWGDVESVGGRIITGPQIRFGGPTLAARKSRGLKNAGFRFDGSGKSFQSESVARHLGEGVKAGDRNKGRATGDHKWTTDFTEAGQKNTGGSWFNIGSPGQKETGRNPVHELSGMKGAGDGWFNDAKRKGGTETGRLSQSGSKSPARKAASAMIAKIPLVLSRHIAKAWYPERAA